jgi:predicted nucleotidyltransferase
MQPHPTAYTDTNAFLDLLLSRIRMTLGNKLVGLYIFGSLVVGDFAYDSSDIDLIAATSTELDEEEVERLKRMHAEVMRPRKYQAYAILTMCRVLYTFKRGEIVSKQQAASWAEKVYFQYISLASALSP